MDNTSVYFNVPYVSMLSTARYVTYQQLIGIPVWYSIQNLGWCIYFSLFFLVHNGRVQVGCYLV